MTEWGCTTFPNDDGAAGDGYFASEYLAGRYTLFSYVSLCHATSDGWLLHLCAIKAESHKGSTIATLLRYLHLSQHMVNEWRAVVAHFFVTFVLQCYLKMIKRLRLRGQ